MGPNRESPEKGLDERAPPTSRPPSRGSASEILGALLLGYHEPDGRLVYAGRVGTGMSQKTLAGLHRLLRALAIPTNASRRSPPRDTRFGRPLELAKVHWVRPELVAEITYLSWPDDGLLRHTVFVGFRRPSDRRL